VKVTTGRSVVLGDRRIALADDQPTFWERVAADSWEPGTRRLIDTLVDASTLFVDLGAWVGPTTLQAAARGARVVAVEADPAALDQLGRNLAANPGLAARVTVVPKAIHPDGGTVTFGARRKPGDSMSSLLLAGADTTWQAEALTPAALAERLPASPRRVIKIDLEGAEYALLPAIAPLVAHANVAVIASFHPRVLAESGETEVAGATRRALAAFAGWRAHRVTEAGAATEAQDAAGIDAVAHDEWLFVRS